MSILLLGTSLVLLLIIFYKLFLESRYKWLSYEDNGSDLDGKKCSWIIYRDSCRPGIQKEYFYDIELTRYLVDGHIKSMNKYHRRSKYLFFLKENTFQP